MIFHICSFQQVVGYIVFLLYAEARSIWGSSFWTLRPRLTLFVQCLLRPVSCWPIIANQYLSINHITFQKKYQFCLQKICCLDVLQSFAYILKTFNGTICSHEATANLICICPNQCSVMSDLWPCPSGRGERLYSLLGDIFDLEKLFCINQVYPNFNVLNGYNDYGILSFLPQTSKFSRMLYL